MKHASKPHRYMVIKEYLQDQITNGFLLPGQQIPTENELMNQFNVSRVTVTNAIKQLVEEGTLYRVAGKGTFLKESLNKNTVDSIGLIMPEDQTMLMSTLLHAVEAACRKNNLFLTVRFTKTDIEERDSIHLLINSGVRGLLILPIGKEVYNMTILNLKTNNFPFVLLDKYIPGVETSAVYSDNRSGGYIGTSYLVKKGHRNIAIVSSAVSQTSSTEDRFLGFLDAAREHKLTLQPENWLTRIQDNFIHVQEEFDRVIDNWLDQLKDVTAIFSFHKDISAHIASYLRGKGLSIPQDMAILSFDDPEYRDLDGPLFTFVRQDMDAIGRESVELMLRIFNNEAINEQILVPVVLCEGRST